MCQATIYFATVSLFKSAHIGLQWGFFCFACCRSYIQSNLFAIDWVTANLSAVIVTNSTVSREITIVYYGGKSYANLSLILFLSLGRSLVVLYDWHFVFLVFFSKPIRRCSDCWSLLTCCLILVGLTEFLPTVDESAWIFNLAFFLFKQS